MGIIMSIHFVSLFSLPLSILVKEMDVRKTIPPVIYCVCLRALAFISMVGGLENGQHFYFVCLFDYFRGYVVFKYKLTLIF